MTPPSDDSLRYPIGRFKAPTGITSEQRAAWLKDIEELPAQLRTAVASMSEAEFEKPYRPGGWTVRQVVHHLADSHLNSYLRFRLALTEDTPTIKPYAEELWAELPDAKSAPVEPSLALLEAMHARWVLLLRAMDEAAFAKTFRHPERGEVRLDWTLGLYSWHGKHHLAHIAGARETN